MLTDKKAWIKCAFTVDSGFPFTRTVNVSSFSDVIKLPNHDRFVSSGEESGVKYTSSDDTAKENCRFSRDFQWKTFLGMNFRLMKILSTKTNGNFSRENTNNYFLSQTRDTFN